jgi:integrase
MISRAARIAGLRFHDLRHTAATRLVEAHIPLPEVGKQLGHTQAQTTWRYINQDAGSARRAAAALEDLLVRKQEQKKEAGERER